MCKKASHTTPCKRVHSVQLSNCTTKLAEIMRNPQDEDATIPSRNLQTWINEDLEIERSKLVAAFAAAQQLLEPSAAISLSQVRSKNDCEMIWANIGVPINAGGWKKTKTTHPKTVGWKVLYFYSRHLTAFPPYYILSPPLPQQPKPGPCRFPLNPTSGGCAKAGFSPADASQ